MELYRGSNVVVDGLRLLRSNRRLDFGSDFYFTSDFNQAARLTSPTSKRRKSKHPAVPVHDFNEKALDAFAMLEFSDDTLECLNYVGLKRNGESTNVRDTIVGAVANDSTMPILHKLHFARISTAEEAVITLSSAKSQESACAQKPARNQAAEFQGVN